MSNVQQSYIAAIVQEYGLQPSTAKIININVPKKLYWHSDDNMFKHIDTKKIYNMKEYYQKITGNRLRHFSYTPDNEGYSSYFTLWIEKEPINGTI